MPNASRATTPYSLIGKSLRQYMAYKRNTPISEFQNSLIAVNVVVRWRLGYNT